MTNSDGQQSSEWRANADIPEQIVVAFLTVAHDLFRADASDRPHFEPIEAFHKLARSTAREFEKLRQPPQPRRSPARRRSRR